MSDKPNPSFSDEKPEGRDEAAEKEQSQAKDPAEESVANPAPEEAEELEIEEDAAPFETADADEEGNVGETTGEAGELLRKLDELQAENERLRSENGDLKDKFLRKVAEMDNYRKRMNRERDDLRKYAPGRLVEDLLPALDNLQLGLDAAEKHPEAKPVAEGFQMVVANIRSVLADNGVVELNPVGENFDPNRHECVSQAPSEDVEEGKVMAVSRRGYMLHERLLRPASVVISTGAAEGNGDADNA